MCPTTEKAIEIAHCSYTLSPRDLKETKIVGVNSWLFEGPYLMFFSESVPIMFFCSFPLLFQVCHIFFQWIPDERKMTWSWTSRTSGLTVSIEANQSIQPTCVSKGEVLSLSLSQNKKGIPIFSKWLRIAGQPVPNTSCVSSTLSSL